jgi:hypothetical protein
MFCCLYPTHVSFFCLRSNLERTIIERTIITYIAHYFVDIFSYFEVFFNELFIVFSSIWQYIIKL